MLTLRKRPPAAHSRTKGAESEDRIDFLLDTAAEVFIEMGFEAASVGEIARRAHASKQTLYARYPTKAALFAAVIARRVEVISTQILAGFAQDAPPPIALPRLGEKLLRFMLSQEVLGIVRLLYLEAANFPEVARSFYELGPRRGRSQVEQYLRRQVAAGHLREMDAAAAAGQFCDLIAGEIVMRSALGLEPSTSARLVRKRVRGAVEVFLAAYGNAPSND